MKVNQFQNLKIINANNKLTDKNEEKMNNDMDDAQYCTTDPDRT